MSEINGTYKEMGKVFTGAYDGDHGPKDVLISKEDFENPKSHLHWNKDFSPTKTAQRFSSARPEPKTNASDARTCATLIFCAVR